MRFRRWICSWFQEARLRDCFLCCGASAGQRHLGEAERAPLPWRTRRESRLPNQNLNLCRARFQRKKWKCPCLGKSERSFFSQYQCFIKSIRVELLRSDPILFAPLFGGRPAYLLAAPFQTALIFRRRPPKPNQTSRRELLYPKNHRKYEIFFAFMQKTNSWFKYSCSAP